MYNLKLNLAATAAGNENTFSTTNAIMKAMLEKKMITGKDYREILRTYYHI